MPGGGDSGGCTDALAPAGSVVPALVVSIVVVALLAVRNPDLQLDGGSGS
jgi:hypothetical protein